MTIMLLYNTLLNRML